MAVKKLSSDIQCLFSSTVHIFSYKKAIEELVYNALDANSTSIAIRIHIQENKIQVVDNGCGIAKEGFDLLGHKHATSKFVDITRYKSAPNLYGFRGQTLACLVETSKCVKITSKKNFFEETWTKTFYKGKRKEVAQTTTRPSKGTTVEVNGFLYNLKIQKKSINCVNEMNEIKTLLEQLSLVHNNVSFSLRDDSSNDIIFKVHKNSDIYKTFKSLFDIDKHDVQELQVEKNEYKVLAFIAKNNVHPDRHHWIFLNKKFVNDSKVYKLVNEKVSKTMNSSRCLVNVKTKHPNRDEDYYGPSNNHIPFYFIFITCPYSDYDVSTTPNQSTLEFKNWDQLTVLVDKLVKFYTGKLVVKVIERSNNVEKDNIIQNEKETADTRLQVREIMKKILGSNARKVGVSQMQNGIKGKLIKRRKKKVPKLTFSKIIPPKGPYLSKIVHLSNNNKKVDQIKINEPTDSSLIANKPSHKTTKEHKINQSHKNKMKSNKKCKEQPPKQLKIKTKNKIRKKPKNNPILKIFENQPSVVRERCKLLAQEVDNLLPRYTEKQQEVFVNETVNYSNITKNNKTISVQKRVGEIIIHDYYPLKSKGQPAIRNLNNNLKKNHVKTSYDLLKSIIDTNTVNTQNRIPSVHLDRVNVPREKFSNQNEIRMPQLTYQSHHYMSNQTKSHKYENNNSIENNNYNDHASYTTMADSALPIQTNNTLMNSYLHTLDKNIMKQIEKPYFKKFNIPSFSDIFTSHTIEVSDSRNDQKTLIRDIPTNYREIDADKTHDISITNVQTQFPYNIVNSTIGVTYTVTASSTTSKYKNDPYTQNENLDSDWISKFLQTQTKEVKNMNPKTNDLNVVFVSNSDNQMNNNSNNEIDPLNICETILTSDEVETEPKITKVQTQLNDSLFNLTRREFSSNVRNLDTIGDTQQLLQSPTNQLSSMENPIDTGSHKEVACGNENFIGDTLEQIDVDQIIYSINTEQAVSNIGERKDFDIKSRPRFLPKGMSPIFKNNCLKCKNDTNLESGYFADDLYTKFRDDVKTHTEVYEAPVQNPKDVVTKNIAKVSSRLVKEYSSLTFDDESLKEADILGQIDNKFIASIIRGKSDQLEYLVLFDQHAVHERIRLEQNLADYFKKNEWKIAKLDDVVLKLSKDEVIYLHNYRDKFIQFGLDWTILDDSRITLHGIPAAILGKNPRQVEKAVTAVRNLIAEEINMIRYQKGCVSLYPKSIMDLVFSEACRYAIKFGDKLPHSECVDLIHTLATCKTPFQCAHGRPVMAVIMDIKPETRSYKINMERVRQLQKQLKK